MAPNRFVAVLAHSLVDVCPFSSHPHYALAIAARSNAARGVSSVRVMVLKPVVLAVVRAVVAADSPGSAT